MRRESIIQKVLFYNKSQSVSHRYAHRFICERESKSNANEYLANKGFSIFTSTFVHKIEKVKRLKISIFIMYVLFMSFSYK